MTHKIEGLNEKNHNKNLVNTDNFGDSNFILNLDEKFEFNVANTNNSNNVESNIHETMVSTSNEKKLKNIIKTKCLKKEMSKDIEPKNFNDNFIFYNKRYESRTRKKNNNSEMNAEDYKKDDGKFCHGFEEIKTEEIPNDSIKSINFHNSYLNNNEDKNFLDIEINKKIKNIDLEIESKKYTEESKDLEKKGYNK